MKIDSERYVSVTSIGLCFGEIMCSVLPAYYCITGCDTTSYPANIGKVRPFQKQIEKQAFHLLENLGSHINSYKDVEHEKRFYHIIQLSILVYQERVLLKVQFECIKKKHQDKFNSYIWWGKHCATFEEKWFAMFYMEAMYEAEYGYT